MAPRWLQKSLGQEQQYIPPPLPPDAQIQQTYAGSMMSGRGLGWGGELGVTDTGIYASPMNVRGAQRVVGLVARAGGVPGFGGINYLVNRAVPEPVFIPYSEMTSVGPGSGPGFFSPPTVRVQTPAQMYEFGPTGRLWVLSRSQQALQARNQFLAQVAAARAARGY
jgi:hypothetical protein